MHQNDTRFNIFGTHFSCLDLKGGFKIIVNHDFSKPGYVCFPSTNTIAEAFKDANLRDIYNTSFITFADGKFTEFYARLKGNKKLKNVSGFDLLNLLLQSNLTHFFYGLSPNQLFLLENTIRKEFPNARVLGYKSPPWINSGNVFPHPEIFKDIEYINELKPDLIWIGISYPKQEYLMKHYINYLKRGVMIGVGAVLLYRANIIKIGPRWIKNLGLRWLIRLIQEPKRLWRRMMPGIVNIIYLFIKHDILHINSKMKP